MHPCEIDNDGCEQKCERKGEDEAVCTCEVGWKVVSGYEKKCEPSKLLSRFLKYGLPLMSLIVSMLYMIRALPLYLEELLEDWEINQLDYASGSL